MENEGINRSIVEVFNCETDVRESVADLVAKGERFIFNLRTRIENGIQNDCPIYLCVACGQALVIRCRKLGMPNGRHTTYFRHLKNSDDCCLKAESTLSRREVLVNKFNGQKEGDTHENIKNYLALWLRADSRFTDVKVESTIKGTGIFSKKWRRPDVSARFNGKLMVFEIQLSTTFLDVIVGRDNFYKENDIIIFWIFGEFDPNNARAAEKDIYFNNKANVFSIDADSLEMTEKEEVLFFSGYYGIKISERIIWEKVLISFDDINFDGENYKPYFISVRQQALAALEWVVLRNEEISTLSLDCLSELELLGVSCSCLSNQDFINLLKVLISIRENKVFFACDWENKWFWLADYVWGGFNCYWVAFLHAVDAYGLKDVIFNAGYIDIDEKHAYFKSNRKKFGQNRVYNSFFCELLPLLKGRLNVL